MKRIVAGVAALVFTHAALAGDTTPGKWKRSEIYVTGVADIDAQGKVEHIDLLPVGKELSAPLAEIAKATMYHWEFWPSTANGKPATTHAFLHGAFEFRPSGGNYEANLVFIGTGPQIDKRPAPRYPHDMMADHVQATLSMLVVVQPDGSLSNIELESAKSTGGRPVAEFVRTATEAMRSWHAEPVTVDGHAVSSAVRIPIRFTLHDGVGGQFDPQLQRSRDSPAEPRETSVGEQSLALDSPIKLRPQSP